MNRIAALILTAATLTGCAATTQASVPTPNGTSIDGLLANVRVIPNRPNPAGYDRTCGTNHACSFGAAWTDKHNGTGGRNGCDTRDDVLAKQLAKASRKAGSDCIVISGSLNDPYTGRQITFTKAKASAVQIDHLYPLALAWDMGANKWTQQRRIDFANDQMLNLLAVDGHANQAKGDSGPGEWLPVNKAYRCTYLARFLIVAQHYDLPITKADADSIRVTAKGCKGAQG